MGVFVLDIPLGSINSASGSLLTAAGQEDMGFMASKGYSGGISETIIGTSDDGNLSCLVWDLIIREVATFEVGLPVLKLAV